MSVVTTVLPIPVLAAALILAGYGFTVRWPGLRPAERLALAGVLGLAVVLWSVGIVNFFQPLRGPAAWVVFWPILLTLGWPASRRQLGGDLAVLGADSRMRLAVVLGLAFLALAFWPKLARPELIYFDGTSSHDGYFWVTGAQQLQTQTYMTSVTADPAHPWANLTGAIRGWTPMWGRAGAEGFLAVVASVAGTDPLTLYLAALAALFVPWVAAVYLVVRTFHTARLTPVAVAGLVALQPLYLFFQANGNLPNLLGALCGALVVVATARSLRETPDRLRWLAALAVGLQGLLQTYPEIAPFIALPAGLLVLRAMASRLSRRAAGHTVMAVVAGLALNPATTVRAVNGFLHSFNAARLDYEWADIFDRLSPAQYAPALVTLSVPAARFFGPVPGLAATLLLAFIGFQAVRHARDRFGVLASLSGGGALLAYTFVFDFSYGLQKSAQFAALFSAALWPVAVLQFATGRPGWRLFPRLLAAATAALLLTAVVFHSLEINKWARRKGLTTEWTSLAALARSSLAGREILIEPATFDMAFFDGMWAAYFLRDHPLVYAVRGDQNGGYIRGTVRREPAGAPARPAAVLVSRAWADAFDPGAPRLFTGESVVLLASPSRLLRAEGLEPAQGLPDVARGSVKLDLHPTMPGLLRLELRPQANTPATEGWRVNHQVAGGAPASFTVKGPPPWLLEVQLVPGQSNLIELTALGTFAPGEIPTYEVRQFRVMPSP